MWLNELRRRWQVRTRPFLGKRPVKARMARVPPILESLEDRTLLSTFTAGTVAALVNDINAANHAGGSNTIALTAPTFTLSAVDNTTDGPTGLPVIAAGDHLTINGNGAVLMRSTASGTPAFRFFDVAGGASLTLHDLILKNGLAFGAGVAAEGGVIFNQGKLTLSAATLLSNVAKGSDGAAGSGASGQRAAGGGIFSNNGSVTVTGSTLFQLDHARGGGGASGSSPGKGGDAFGGVIAAVNSELSLGSGVDFFGDGALAGDGGAGGGAGGAAAGGGVWASAGSVAATGVEFQAGAGGGNGGTGATSGNGGNGSNGSGGGLYASNATVTLANTIFQGDATAGSGGSGGRAALPGGTGGAGGDASGGGMTVIGGSLISTGTLQCLQTFVAPGRGGSGGSGPHGGAGGSGGNGLGGGIYANGATLKLAGSSILESIFVGAGSGGFGGRATTTTGTGGNGGATGQANGGAFGGGLFVSGGSVTLVIDTVELNTAVGGLSNGSQGTRSTAAAGGGIYKAGGTLTLDAFTLGHVINNTDSNNDGFNDLFP